LLAICPPADCVEARVSGLIQTSRARDVRISLCSQTEVIPQARPELLDLRRVLTKHLKRFFQCLQLVRLVPAATTDMAKSDSIITLSPGSPSTGLPNPRYLCSPISRSCVELQKWCRSIQGPRSAFASCAPDQPVAYRTHIAIDTKWHCYRRSIAQKPAMAHH